MITTVSNASALQNALANAQAGDTIQLAGGSYDAIRITGQHFSQDVNITAAPGAQPVISSLMVMGSSGLTFSNLEIQLASSATRFEVNGSQDIHFSGLKVHGSLDGNPSNDPIGLLIRGSSHVTVEGSEFQQLESGITHVGSENVVIRDNSFHDLRMDGIRGGGSSFVTIADNDFRDFYPVGADHPDAIQFWTSGTTASAHDIVITGNTYVRGQGEIAQGIFVSDEGDLPYQRVTITDNLIVGASYHGITVGHGEDVTVTDNVVVGLSDRKSWIFLGKVDGAASHGNVANEYQFGDITGLVSSNNATTGLASDKGLAVIAEHGGSKLLGAPAISDKVMTGGFGNTTLEGGAGADIIVDTGGSNYLRGGDGADRVQGGGGFDDMNGNSGADTLSGGADNDWVVGGRDNDSLSGDLGDDLVYGNLGADTCAGGDGADTLRGGQDDDLLLGGADADYLSGDKGSDTMTGGAGSDIFHSFGDAGLDRISDFSFADGDRLRLDLGTTYSVSQVGSDTVVDMGGGQVVLAGVSMSSLGSGWLFVG